MEIRKISRSDCSYLILNVHYAKRFPSVSYAYGLFIDNELKGIVTYGTPASSTLRRGVATDKFQKYVLELNRLVLVDNKPNQASFLVSHSLKLLKKEVYNAIIISFADTEQGHSGVVYRASNFIYTGLSAKRTDWKVRGKEHLHGQTIADEFRGLPNRAALMREKYGDDFYLKERSRKHRYIYIIGTRSFKKAVKNSLSYKQIAW